MPLLLRLYMFAGLFFSLTALGVPTSKLWPRWQANGPGLAVDDTAWATFLARYRVMGADGVARVAYGRVSGADKAALKAYVAKLAATDVDRMTRPQQYAYWVNLYNAATVQLILDNYPITSITKLKSGLISFGPWDRKLLSVKGEALSLNDIEHRILRPIWKDPRVHFVINCASIGCPDLGATPLRPETLDTQLNAARDAFLRHPRGLRRVKDGVRLSSIFNWYGVDFGGKAGVVSYAGLPVGTPIKGYDYDWNLNEAR